jgi:hypothetical protein
MRCPAAHSIAARVPQNIVLEVARRCDRIAKETIRIGSSGRNARAADVDAVEVEIAGISGPGNVSDPDNRVGAGDGTARGINAQANHVVLEGRASGTGSAARGDRSTSHYDSPHLRGRGATNDHIGMNEIALHDICRGREGDIDGINGGRKGP